MRRVTNQSKVVNGRPTATARRSKSLLIAIRAVPPNDPAHRPGGRGVRLETEAPSPGSMELAGSAGSSSWFCISRILNCNGELLASVKRSRKEYPIRCQKISRRVAGLPKRKREALSREVAHYHEHKIVCHRFVYGSASRRRPPTSEVKHAPDDREPNQICGYRRQKNDCESFFHCACDVAERSRSGAPGQRRSNRTKRLDRRCPGAGWLASFMSRELHRPGNWNDHALVSYENLIFRNPSMKLFRKRRRKKR